MYIKLAGICIVMTATCSIGYIMGERAKRQLEIVSSLRRCMGIIESEVRYMGTEMRKIFEMISEKEEEWASFFGCMAKYMESDYQIKKDFIIQEKITEELQKEDRSDLIRFMCEPCGYDRQNELGRINIYMNRLDTRITALESDLKGRVKLMRMLGLSSGVFLILLII